MSLAFPEGRAAFVGYLPAGFDDAAFDVLAEQADVVEVGLPYSDPLLDGPVIQRAVQRALEAGTRPRDVLRVVERIAATGTPAVVMTYWNPVDRYGPAAFARDLAAAGGAGVITPDLIPEEAGEWLAAAEEHGLAPVFLVAPSSSDERVRLVAETNRGFVYAASTMGVTGVRSEVDASALVARVRAVTELPVAVGIGVSDGEQAAAVAAYADGVIVGSALVRALLDGADFAALVGELAAGVRAGSPA